MGLACLLLVPAVATLWTAFDKFQVPVPPDPWALSLTGTGALVLARYRHHAGSLTRAASLSARNDALANVAIIATGLVTVATQSPWPDLAVGLGIALLNADAAK